MAVAVKMKIDMKEFTALTTKAPGIMDGLVKESFTRGGAKMRKEFIKTMERGNYAALQETPEYKSKYSKPLQMLKGMVRYKVTGGKKRVTATIGIFPGKAGRSKLVNSKFVSLYGVTVTKMAQLLTYGGKLRVSGRAMISRMIRQGFHPRKGLKFIHFPKRDWFTPTKWKNASVIIPYIQEDLNARITKRFGSRHFR